MQMKNVEDNRDWHGLSLREVLSSEVQGYLSSLTIRLKSQLRKMQKGEWST